MARRGDGIYQRGVMDLLLEIATEVDARGRRIAELAEAWIRAEPENLQGLTHTDRVVAGLSLKMLFTF